MISAKEYALRRENLLNKMSEGSIALLFSGVGKKQSADENYPFEVNRNFYYLTGIDQENSILMLVKSDSSYESYLFIDEKNEKIEKWYGIKLSTTEASQTSGIHNVLLRSSFNGKLATALDKKLHHFGEINTIYLDLEDELKIAKATSTHEYKTFLDANFPGYVVKDIYKDIASLRMVKSKEEIALIKDAIRTTEVGLNNVLKDLAVGRYEYNLRNIFEYTLHEDMQSGIAFPTIVASGKNGVILHYPQAKDILKDNELVLMDCGAAKSYYCADISRTYPINGKFNEKQKLIYSIVLACNKATAKFMAPGLTLDEVKEFAKQFLAKECTKAGLIENENEISRVYYHGVSHHLGLDTHDVVDDYKKPLEPGNVITCEPGLYFKEYNIGIRIEDDILITPDGSETLSKDIIKEVDDIERFLISK